jgi:hypothetical protein
MYSHYDLYDWQRLDPAYDANKHCFGLTLQEKTIARHQGILIGAATLVQITHFEVKT